MDQANGSSSFGPSLAPELLTCSGIQSSHSGESNSLDINSLIQEILRRRTHSLHLRQFDAINLFAIVKTVLIRQTQTVTANSTTLVTSFDATVADAIRKLSCKMACNCSGENVGYTVKEIVQGNSYLAKYDFDAWMVISLAAFAVNYGQFRILMDCCSQTNSQVGQAMMNLLVLKQLQFDVQTNFDLVARINTLMEFVLKMIELALQLIQIRRNLNATNSIIEQCLAQAACVTIYTLVHCSSFITAPAGFGFDLKAIHLNLQELANGVVGVTIRSLELTIQSTSQDQVDWKRLRDIFCNVKVPSIAEILIALIGAPTIAEANLVIGCNTTQKVRFDEVKGKNVYLLITGAYTTVNEINGLVEFVNKQKDHQLIWIPISIDERFKGMQALMNWYTVQHPKYIRPGAIRFITETCPFKNQTVLVPLCQKQLEFYSIDWLWSRCIFPVPDSPPLQLPQLLSFNYLLSDIYDLRISTKTSTPPIVCLYGGEDPAWITSFIQRMGEVKNLASSSNINIEFIYVSKSDGIDNAKQDIFNFLDETKFGCVWKSEGTECWHFWIRLESFFREQMRVGISTKVDIMKQVITLLSYNTNDKGWAVFGEYTGRGTDTCVKLAQATGSIAEVAFKTLPRTWFVNSAAFVKAVGDQFDRCVKEQPHHCSHIMLPARMGDFDGMITCPICDNTMSNYRFYRCCA